MKSKADINLEVTLFTRQDCSLCHIAEDDLAQLQKEVPHTLTVVDIDQDPDLQALYGHKVPVIVAGSYTLPAPFDKRKLRMTLGAAYDSQLRQMEEGGEKFVKRQERKNRINSGDKISHFISNHYLKVVNLVLLIYFRYVMGFFMRHFERQADLYSALAIGTPEYTVSSLEKIAFAGGKSRDLPSWHHFSISERVACLRRTIGDPGLDQFVAGFFRTLSASADQDNRHTALRVILDHTAEYKLPDFSDEVRIDDPVGLVDPCHVDRAFRVTDKQKLHA